jgi:serine/threonine protein kinase
MPKSRKPNAGGTADESPPPKSDSDSDVEDPRDYRRGGYHPVEVGELFKRGRYVAAKKLGWGHFSTVWLAWDRQERRAIALKIQKSAVKYSETARDEIKLLQQVSEAKARLHAAASPQPVQAAAALPSDGAGSAAAPACTSNGSPGGVAHRSAPLLGGDGGGGRDGLANGRVARCGDGDGDGGVAGRAMTVVELRDHFVHRGTHGAHHVLCFEVLGPSLLHMLKLTDYRGLPLRHARTLARCLLSALAFIHAEGIIHTDVKPENVLVDLSADEAAHFEAGAMRADADARAVAAARGGAATALVAGGAEDGVSIPSEAGGASHASAVGAAIEVAGMAAVKAVGRSKNSRKRMKQKEKKRMHAAGGAGDGIGGEGAEEGAGNGGGDGGGDDGGDLDGKGGDMAVAEHAGNGCGGHAAEGASNLDEGEEEEQAWEERAPAGQNTDGGQDTQEGHAGGRGQAKAGGPAGAELSDAIGRVAALSLGEEVARTPSGGAKQKNGKHSAAPSVAAPASLNASGAGRSNEVAAPRPPAGQAQVSGGAGAMANNTASPAGLSLDAEGAGDGRQQGRNRAASRPEANVDASCTHSQQTAAAAPAHAAKPGQGVGGDVATQGAGGAKAGQGAGEANAGQGAGHAKAGQGACGAGLSPCGPLPKPTLATASVQVAGGAGPAQGAGNAAPAQRAGGAAALAFGPLPTFKLADLGNGCWRDRQFTQDIQTRQYRCPEVILGQGYDTASDVWSAACVVFEAVTGDVLFTPRAGKQWSRDEDHLALMLELIGPMPRKLTGQGEHAREFFRGGELRHIKRLRPWPLVEVLKHKYEMPADEAEALADFLVPMLQHDPIKRATAEEALRHPWLSQ